MLLLLLSLILGPFRRVDSLRAQKVYAVLWEWRDAPLADDWLCGSSECRRFGNSGPFDIIEESRRFFQRQGAEALGVTPSQHADLLAWCDKLLARRAELKAGATK